MSTTTRSTGPAIDGSRRRRAGVVPGTALGLTAAVVGLGVGHLQPVASPLLVAILLGAVAANLGMLPESAGPGLAWSGRRLLRAGVVLLGLQLSLREVVGLGPGVLVLVLVLVAGGITSTMLLGQLLAVSWTQRLLIACGFSICGAAAAAAVDGVVDADEEEAATAIALVVVCGTAMIGILPAMVHLCGLSHREGGIWAGASIHEVAQVVAAGGIVGGGALGIAVVIKLARVLLLAPVMVLVGWRLRRRGATTHQMPPLVPLFVAGFCAMVAVHTWVPLPTGLLDGAKDAETVLLAAAMFALGAGVRVTALRRTGITPILLAIASTAVVGALGLTGALLIG